MKKVHIGNIVFATLFIAVTGWLAISWIDVLAHQTTGGTDAAWNAFVMLINLGKGW